MTAFDQVAWARRLKIRHLETFLVLEEAGTLTQAADRMHMTQSAMSHWLADLESVVGMPLVVRKRRIELTPAGVVLKRLAISVLGDLSRTQLELGVVADGRSARLNIGSIWAGMAQLVPETVAEFQRRHPYVAVSVSESPFSSLLEKLEAKQLDVVVGSLDSRAHSDRLEHRELFVDNVSLVVGRASRFWDATDPMSLRELAEADWIMPPRGTLTRTQLDAALLACGASWVRPKVETEAITTMQAMIHRADYVGACSQAMARYLAQLGNLRILNADAEIQFGPVGVVWSADNTADAVRLFVDELCGRAGGCASAVYHRD